MATHDYVISNASGASVRADLNNALAAIVSNNSNATSPATTYAYQWWADTTTGQLKLRNSANSAWITIFELDGTMLMEDGSLAAPGLAFASDLDTGFSRSASNKINFSTGGAERLEIGDSEVVFNDPSNDVDFRVESNGNSHMLFVDAGNDRVGIGSSSPSFPLTVQSDSGTNSIAVLGRSADDISSTLFYENDGTTQIGRLQARQSYFQISGTDNNKGIFIDNAGEVGIGTSSPNNNLEISSSTGGIIRLTDSGGGHALLEGGDGNVAIQADAGNTEASSKIQFLVDNSEKARIDDSGRLLVGTTTAVGTSNAVIIKGTSGVSNASIYLGNTANASTLVAGNTLGFIEYGAADGGTGAQVLAAADGTWSSTSDCPTRLVFSTCADSASSPTERLRIDSSGNVGIGVGSAAGKLHVFKGNGARNDYSTSADGLVIESSSDTGISIDPGAGNTANIYFPNAANHSIASISHDLSTGELNLRAATFLRFSGSSNTERARIDNSGHLGVGISSPVAQVQINSDKNAETNKHQGGNYHLLLKNDQDDTGEAIGMAFSITSNATAVGAAILHERDGGGSQGSLQFLTNGGSDTISERMRITSDGKMLINSTSAFGSGNEQLQISRSGGGAIALARNDTSIGSGNEMGHISWYGNDSDGTFNRIGKISLSASENHSTTSKPTTLTFSTTKTNATTPTERFRIDNLGRVDHFSSDGNGFELHHAETGAGDVAFLLKKGASNLEDGTSCMQILADGDIENTNNRYTQISDIKFKENIVDASSQWEDLKAIRVVNFNFKAEKNWGTHRQIGVVAQEIETVSPGLICQRREENGEEYKSVAYSLLYMKAVKALQEAMDRIETLEAKVAALEAG